MKRVHDRTDLTYEVRPCRAYFTRRAYACIISQSTAYADQRALYDVVRFCGNDGRKVRAEAMRFGALTCRGLRLSRWREQRYPGGMDLTGLPLPERDIQLR